MMWESCIKGLLSLVGPPLGGANLVSLMGLPRGAEFRMKSKAVAASLLLIAIQVSAWKLSDMKTMQTM